MPAIWDGADSPVAGTTIHTSSGVRGLAGFSVQILGKPKFVSTLELATVPFVANLMMNIQISTNLGKLSCLPINLSSQNVSGGTFDMDFLTVGEGVNQTLVTGIAWDILPWHLEDKLNEEFVATGSETAHTFFLVRCSTPAWFTRDASHSAYASEFCEGFTSRRVPPNNYRIYIFSYRTFGNNPTDIRPVPPSIDVDNISWNLGMENRMWRRIHQEQDETFVDNGDPVDRRMWPR